jgi:hypothetical protein
MKPGAAFPFFLVAFSGKLRDGTMYHVTENLVYLRTHEEGGGKKRGKKV